MAGGEEVLITRGGEPVARLEPGRRDPFDRLLVAQATAEDVPILTADAVFARYPVERIAAG